MIHHFTPVILPFLSSFVGACTFVHVFVNDEETRCPQDYSYGTRNTCQRFKAILQKKLRSQGLQKGCGAVCQKDNGDLLQLSQ